MADKKNEISDFKYDFKNRKIKEIDVVKRNNQLAIYKITFGEEMAKVSKTDLILERLEKMEIRMNNQFESIDKRFDRLESKVDNLTECIVELQSEAKNHDWNINKETK